MEKNESRMIDESKKRKLEKNEKIETFTYIGETWRSAKERGEEHEKDLEHCRARSLMLRHIVEHHKKRTSWKYRF